MTKMNLKIMMLISYFHEDINEEEDFEIPAFLRKQKF